MSSYEDDREHYSHNEAELHELEMQMPSELVALMKRLAEEKRPAIFESVEQQFRAALGGALTDQENNWLEQYPHFKTETAFAESLATIGGLQQDDDSVVNDSVEMRDNAFDYMTANTSVNHVPNSGLQHNLDETKEKNEQETSNLMNDLLTNSSNCYVQNETHVSSDCFRKAATALKSTINISQTSQRLLEAAGCTNAAPKQSESKQDGHVVQRDDLTYNTSRSSNVQHVICTPDCVRRFESLELFASARTDNLLCLPLRLGWRREVRSERDLSILDNTASYVVYTAPCGRQLRNAIELDRFLLDTDSRLEIDVFSFDVADNPLLYFKVTKPLYYENDVSFGSEKMPVSAVNSLQPVKPPAIEYITKSVPSADVLRAGGLSLDAGFLAGCDCVDNCRDKSKCSCQQYTMTNVYRVDTMRDMDASYSYKRLYKCISTGVFECNSHCKCDRRCNNRVVQNGVRLRLQLFRTERKGWGVRCIDDVPRGTYVCTYVGELLRDEAANNRGLDYGDEYLSNLDLIELVDNARSQPKVGYQANVSVADRELIKALDSCSSSDNEDEEREDEDDPDWCADAESRPRSGAKRSLATNRAQNAARRRSTKCSFTRLIAVPDDEQETTKLLQPQFRSTLYAPSNGLTLSMPSCASSSSTKRPEGLSLRRQLFSEDEPFVIDSRQYGGIARFLNHSCAPNLFVQNVFVDTHDVRFPRIAFFSIRHISAGTELCWDYNYALGQLPGREISCLCGADNCRGRLL